MPNLEIYAGETRYMFFPITTNSNPLNDAVAVAFVTPLTTPVSADWKAGDWAPGQTWSADPDTGKGKVSARALVGPGGVVTLEAGKLYDVVVRVTDSPEIPWLRSGTVLVR